MELLKRFLWVRKILVKLKIHILVATTLSINEINFLSEVYQIGH